MLKKNHPVVFVTCNDPACWHRMVRPKKIQKMNQFCLCRGTCNVKLGHEMENCATTYVILKFGYFPRVTINLDNKITFSPEGFFRFVSQSRCLSFPAWPLLSNDRYYSLLLWTLVGPYIETCKLTVIDSWLKLTFISAFSSIYFYNECISGNTSDWQKGWTILNRRRLLTVPINWSTTERSNVNVNSANLNKWKRLLRLINHSFRIYLVNGNNQTFIVHKNSLFSVYTEAQSGHCKKFYDDINRKTFY